MKTAVYVTFVQCFVVKYVFHSRRNTQMYLVMQITTTIVLLA